MCGVGLVTGMDIGVRVGENSKNDGLGQGELGC